MLSKQRSLFWLRKSVAATTIFLYLVAVMTQPVFAVSIPGASSIASQIEKRYHLNTESLQSYGETLNVSEQKQPAPEVMLFFNPSSPKPGEQLTATAHPLYFSTDKNDLYYTWYLKHKDCDIKEKPSKEEARKCDADGDGKITTNDWKVESARIIASNYYEKKQDDYAGNDGDGNGDGYEAQYGGDRREYAKSSYCYVHDFNSGVNYELAKGSQSVFNCPAGTTAICGEDTTMVCSGVMGSTSTTGAQGGTGGTGTGYGSGSGGDGGGGGGGGGTGTGGQGGSSTGSTATCGKSFIEATVCENSGVRPSCVDSVMSCSVGTPMCINTGSLGGSCPSSTIQTQSGSSASGGSASGSAKCEITSDSGDTAKSCTALVGTSKFSCTATTETQTESFCKHLFAEVPGSAIKTGDGEFRKDEERFWRTDPNDTDTADLGSKDEANVVGLGRDTFTWNYVEGDKIGVAVEGFSMINTKHDDSSIMVMWALPKNDCPVGDTGEYTKKIKGYDVKISTANMDINDCLRRNLVDPREGGQATRLDMSLQYSPNNPMNDSTDMVFGDVLSVQSIIKNGVTEEANVRYEWNVYISGDGSYNPRNYEFNQTEDNKDPSDGYASTADWINITKALQNNKLVQHTEGNDLKQIAIDLNITDGVLKSTETTKDLSIKNLFPGNVGYLRITTTARENFQDGVTRSGKAQVIVKVMLNNNRIVPYIATPVEEDGVMTMDIDRNAPPICEIDKNNLIRGVICYVTKDEVIGLEVTDKNLSEFSWKINGQSYTCNSAISKKKCADGKQTNYLFFPVTGNPGSQFNVTVSAMEVDTGKYVELSKNFVIADPYIRIVPKDDSGNVWKKYIGYYSDENGEQFSSYSDDVLQSFANQDVLLKAEFHPSFIYKYSLIRWEVNGNSVPFFDNAQSAGKNPIYATASGGADKQTSHLFIKGNLTNPGDAYAITIRAMYKQPELLRKALKQIWGISVFESAQQEFSFSSRLEMVNNTETGGEVAKAGTGALLGALLTNTPKAFFFFLQVGISMLVVFFIMSFAFSVSQASGLRRDRDS